MDLTVLTAVADPLLLTLQQNPLGAVLLIALVLAWQRHDD